MADMYDIEDIVFNGIKNACGDFIPYKGRSIDGETLNHITVKSLSHTELTFVSTDNVNINIYIRRLNNGMEKRDVIKKIVKDVKSALLNITPVSGMHWKSEILWIMPSEESKVDFDCINIRFRVITEK